MPSYGPSLNSATVGQIQLPELIEIATAHGFTALGLWRQVYAALPLEQTSRMLGDFGLSVSSICRAGMFTHETHAEEMEAWDDNRRAVEEAHALNADCLVLVCGGAYNGDFPTAREQICEGIARLAPFAADHDVRLAIEPMHPMMAIARSAITTLAEANNILTEIQHPNLGIAVDSYHVYWDPQLRSELMRAGESIFALQLSDWVSPVEHELRNRGMPGEGSLNLASLFKNAQEAGYRGYVEVEVLSDRWDSRPASDAAFSAREGLARLDLMEELP